MSLTSAQGEGATCGSARNRGRALCAAPQLHIYPPDGLLTSEGFKYDVDFDPRIIAPDPSISDDYLDDFISAHICLLTPTDELNMDTSEDEPSTGLNGRLRPRKSHGLSPLGKVKSEAKTSSDKSKRTSTPSKAQTIKQDDISKKPEISSTSHFLCTFCDKKFASRQTVSKHIRRMHYSTTKTEDFLKCLFCNHAEEDTDIIRHMVDSHPNQYFACLDCHTRFASTSELAEHKLNVCEKQKFTYRTKVRQKITRGSKKPKKSVDIARKTNFPTHDKDFQEGHGFNGIVISCELKPPQDREEADIEDNITTNLILPSTKNLAAKAVLENNAVIVLDDIQWNKRIPPNFAFQNADPDQILSRLGVVHKSPRTGESTKKDWYKSLDDSIEKFERCFDTKFYSKVASNVQENLTKYLDGSFNFKPEPDNIIKTRSSKNHVVINAAEGFPILLACEQYSRSAFDSYMPRAIAPKHKWKWDSVENDKSFMTAAEILKRDSHANKCIITLISSLDIWTQLKMRKTFEDKFKIQPLEKKTAKQIIISKELKEILERREIPTSSQVVKKCTSKSSLRNSELEFPASLGLVPAPPVHEVPPAVLSGEWVRPRCFVCCACGEDTTDSKTLSLHISTRHPNAQVQYYEIVGDQLLNSDTLKHLYVPPSQVSNRTRPTRGFRECTKCNKSVTLDDLHQHMLDCAGDVPAVRRRQPRQRPFGVRRRRSRIPDTTIRKKIRKDIRSRQRRSKSHIASRPRIRTEVGDAETIRKMIADLPAKRHRVLVNPTNMIQRPRRKLDLQRTKRIIKKSFEEFKSRRQTLRRRPSEEKGGHLVDDSARNTSGLDDDEDNKPLKPKLKLKPKIPLGRRAALTRQAVITAKTKSLRVGRRRIVENANKTAENSITEQDIEQDSAETPSNPERLDINNAPFNTREHGNRGTSNGRDDSRPGSSGTNGSDNNNCAPPQNAPLKHSIARLTANSETHDKSVQFHHSFLVQQECNNTEQHVPTGQPIFFENEAVVSKLDKPPLNFCPRALYEISKNKTNKPRKGLNDCIAMLKNKLVDPIPGHDTGHVSVQCGSDEPIDDDPRDVMHTTMVRDADIGIALRSEILQTEERFPSEYRQETVTRLRRVSEPAQTQDSQISVALVKSNILSALDTSNCGEIKKKSRFSSQSRPGGISKTRHSSASIQSHETCDVLHQYKKDSHKIKQTSEYSQALDDFNFTAQYSYETAGKIKTPTEKVPSQETYNFVPQYRLEPKQKINQNLEFNHHDSDNSLSQYQTASTNKTRCSDDITKKTASFGRTSFDDNNTRAFCNEISATTLTRRNSTHSQAPETLKEHTQRRSVEVYYESDISRKDRYDVWQKPLDVLQGKSYVLPKSIEVLPANSKLLPKASDLQAPKGLPTKQLEIFSAKGGVVEHYDLIPRSVELLPVKSHALSTSHEALSAKSGRSSKSPQPLSTTSGILRKPSDMIAPMCTRVPKTLEVFPSKSNILQKPDEILQTLSSTIPKSKELIPTKSGVLQSNVQHPPSYTESMILHENPETRVESEILPTNNVEVFGESVMIDIPPAHASTKVESIVSAPLDLSSKVLYATNLTSAGSYDENMTLDLSHKKCENLPPFLDVEDVIVDLRVKPTQPRDSSVTLNLCVKPTNNHAEVAPEDIPSTYPTDLSLRRKRESCKLLEEDPIVQDLSGVTNSLNESECLIASYNTRRNERRYSDHLSGNIKSFKPQIVQEDKETNIAKSDASVVTFSIEIPNNLSQNTGSDKQTAIVKLTPNMEQSSTSEQTKHSEKNISPSDKASILDETSGPIQKHVYDPTLIIPQYKIRANASVTESMGSRLVEESSLTISTKSSDTASARIQVPIYSESITRRVNDETVNSATTSNLSMIDCTSPVYTLTNSCKVVTKIESPKTPEVTYNSNELVVDDKVNYLTPHSNEGTFPTDYKIAPRETYNKGLSDQDQETAKKIAMLPKELVDILGNMPVDHRNQLLNVLPQYVSTSVANSSKSFEINQSALKGTVYAENKGVVSVSDQTRSPITTKPLESAQTPMQSNTDKNLSNILVSGKCQSLYDNTHPIPRNLEQYSQEEKDENDVISAPKSNSIENTDTMHNSVDKIIDLTEDDNDLPISKIGEVIRPITIPSQLLVTEGIATQSKQKSSSDKTASLRAVRIKAPSERQKNSDIYNSLTVEKLSTPKANDFDSTNANKSDVIKTLAIQQAEISSTQHSNKIITLVPTVEVTPTAEPIEATTETTNKPEEISKISANIEIEKDNLAESIPLNVNLKSGTVSTTDSSTVVTAKVENTVDNNKLESPQKINIASTPTTDTNATLPSSDTKETIAKKADEDIIDTLKAQNEPCDIIQEDDSEDDMILAVIVKRKHSQCTKAKSKKTLKVKRGKKSKTSVTTNSAKMDEAKAQLDNHLETSLLNEPKEPIVSTISSVSENNKSKRRAKNDNEPIKQNKLNRQVSLKPDGKRLKLITNEDESKQIILKPNREPMTSLNHEDELEHKSSILQDATSLESKLPGKSSQETDTVDRKKGNLVKKKISLETSSCNVALQDQLGKQTQTVASLNSNAIDQKKQNSEDYDSQNKYVLNEKVVLDKQELSDVSLNDLAKDNFNEDPIRDVDISTTLRRSRRGRLTFMDGDLPTPEIMLDTAVDQKAPLTKKQLIFSKLLLDEENNIKSTLLSPGKEIKSSVKEVTSIIENEDVIHVKSSILSQSKKAIEEEPKSDTSVDKEEKNKSVKRKRSPQVKRKNKKKKSVDSTIEKNKEKLYSTENMNMETLIAAVVNVETHAENANKSVDKIPEASSLIECVKQSEHEDLIQNKDKDIFSVSDDNNTKKTMNLSEKRKLPKITSSVELDNSSKPKKSKLQYNIDADMCEEIKNENLSLQSTNLESSVRSEHFVTTCYDMPNVENTSLLRSAVKVSGSEFYDPYNIDLDDMIQKPEPIRKIGNKSKRVKRKRKSSTKLAEFETAEKDPNTTEESIAEVISKGKLKVLDPVTSSNGKQLGSDVSIIRNVAVKVKTESKNSSHENDYDTTSKNEFEKETCKETTNCAAIGTESDSDESSKSDIPLTKYLEVKTKKIAETDKALITDCLISRRKKSDDQKPSTSGTKKANRAPAIGKYTSSTDLCNDIEEQKRSEQFMESFGFFSKRKPRKSNLLATKKISETFHIIASESDYVYDSSKEKIPKKTDHKKIQKTITEHSQLKCTNFEQDKQKEYLISSYCHVCKKEFKRSDNFLRHQMTVLHVANVGIVEMKLNIDSIPEEPNYLIAYKQHMDRLRILQDKSATQKKNSRNKMLLPTLDQILADVHKTIRAEQLERRGLSIDEALFLDCCELLTKGRPSDPLPTPTDLNSQDQVPQPSTSGTVSIESNSNANVGSVIETMTKESEQGRKNRVKKKDYHATPCTIDPRKLSTEYLLNNTCEYGCEEGRPVPVPVPAPASIVPVESETSKTKKPEYKEKMYPDVIEDIDMFEDKFDKIKRKCRSQAAAAKHVQSISEPSSSHKSRKKTDKRKGKKNSKKNYQNTVLTKGALKGFDGIKVSIPTSDINMAAITHHETSHKKKKKTASKNKREQRVSESSKYDSDVRVKDSSHSQKKVDVYEFMDNEDAELFEFRPSTLMERFKSFNKEVPSTSKRVASPDEPDDLSESASDGDDFVYMSDDYVCSDDETENSLLSELGAVKMDAKKAAHIKRKDVVEKNAVMGKIFKLNAVRSEKKIVKNKETVKPKANMDQLFDSLLEEDPNPCKLNDDSDSPKSVEIESLQALSEAKHKYAREILDEDEHKARRKSLSPDRRYRTSSSPSSQIDESDCLLNLPSKKHEHSKRHKHGPSTSKQHDLDLYGPSTSEVYDIMTPSDCSVTTSSKKQNVLPSKKRIKSPKYHKPPSVAKTSEKLSLGKLQETECDEDAGVARHRARRKCTVGKQNVLAETWSSESEPDGLPPRPTSAESVVVGPGRKKKSRKKDGQTMGRRGRLSFHKKHDNDSRVNSNSRSSVSGAPSTDSGTAGTQLDLENAKENVSGDRELCPPPPPPPPPPPAAGPCTSSAPKARLRPTPYFWSSEGDDDQEQQQQQQHGWIVGNSHKRLVTMLAHAKGRKRNNDDDKGHLVE